MLHSDPTACCVSSELHFRSLDCCDLSQLSFAAEPLLA